MRTRPFPFFVKSLFAAATILALVYFVKSKASFVHSDNDSVTAATKADQTEAKAQEQNPAALATVDNSNNAEKNAELGNENLMAALSAQNNLSAKISTLKNYIHSFEVKRKSLPRQSEVKEIDTDIYIESLKFMTTLSLEAESCQNSRKLLLSQFNQREEVGADLAGLNASLEIFDSICNAGQSKDSK